jgi:hypothetical protein
MFDVTFGTNTESRPLSVSASMDGNMNVFTPFRVFMPSQCVKTHTRLVNRHTFGGARLEYAHVSEHVWNPSSHLGHPREPPILHTE